MRGCEGLSLGGVLDRVQSKDQKVRPFNTALINVGYL